jgi:hypothetical protein
MMIETLEDYIKRRKEDNEHRRASDFVMYLLKEAYEHERKILELRQELREAIDIITKSPQ